MVNDLKIRYSYLKIAGYYSPPFRPLSQAEKNIIIEKIKLSGARIICVGLGTPKQDFWIEENKDILHGVLFLPCGAIFDFFGGRIKKAPKYISLLGFEWLYRLCSKDFRRLFYRYTVLNIEFLLNFTLQNLKLKKYD
jgi:N-acetylglucosaminyldiphosphoundecaprenol N-acetyl-beta-D-mannosaminyltransferase